MGQAGARRPPVCNLEPLMSDVLVRSKLQTVVGRPVLVSRTVCNLEPPHDMGRLHKRLVVVPANRSEFKIWSWGVGVGVDSMQGFASRARLAPVRFESNQLSHFLQGGRGLDY